MQLQVIRRRHASGNLRRVKRKRGEVWYIQARLPNGRQVQKMLGRVWTAGGRPPEGYYTKRNAEVALRQYLALADAGELPQEPGRSGATFGDACDEWLRHKEHVEKIRAGTVREYRSVVDRHLRPAFGDRPLEDITTRDVERWREQLAVEGGISNRTVNKIVTNMGGVFERARRAFGLAVNPVRDLDPKKLPERVEPDRIMPFTVEEVWALVRATQARVDGREFDTPSQEAAARALAEQDAALFLTAAFTGVRMGEILGLRWRDVDFERSKIHVRGGVNGLRQWAPTKGGDERVVPMVDEVARALDEIQPSVPEPIITPDAVIVPESLEDQLVFPSVAVREGRFAEAGEIVTVNEFLDPSALRRRFKRAFADAGLRTRRFHNLRHTFGSIAINQGSLTDVQRWMGHADIETTARYLHYQQRGDEARRLGRAFRRPETLEAPADELSSVGAER
jgi:integrase